MVHCIQITIAYSTAARRDQARTAISSRVTGKGRWGTPEILASAPVDIGPNGLTIEWRFPNQADAADLYDFMLTRTPAPIAGSLMIQHTCPHDEARNACTITRTKTW